VCRQRARKRIGMKVVKTSGRKEKMIQRLGQSNIEKRSRQKKALDMIRGEIDQSGLYRLGILTRKKRRRDQRRRELLMFWEAPPMVPPKGIL